MHISKQFISIVIIIIGLVSLSNSTGTEVRPCPSADTSVNKEQCIYEDETVHYTWNCSCFQNSSMLSIRSSAKVANSNLNQLENAVIVAHADTNHSLCNDNGVFSIPITGRYLGEMIFDIEGDSIDGSKDYLAVKVCRKQTLLENIIMLIVMPLVLINKFAFGAKIEMDSLKEYVLKPKELSLCFLVQFGLIPLTAILWGWVFKLDVLAVLSLLVGAVCPGGGGGYVFSYLIDGDITLAIAASLFSTLFAMVAMPAVIGLYTFFAAIPHDIIIPYTKIILILVMIAVPISSGMLLRHYRPEWAKKLIKIIRPMSLFLILVGSVMMAFMTRYVVIYGPWQGYVLAFLLPGGGYLIAAILSKLCGFDWAKTKAISLESGMKNTLLGVAVIEISFGQPTADLSSVIILMVTAGQTILCVLFYALYLIKSKLFAGNGDDTKVAFGRDIPEDTVAFLNSYQ